MNKKKIIINGDSFHDIESFYNEVDRVLTKNLNFRAGHNLDALNDLLWGGFGVHDYEKPLNIVWTNFSRSKKVLGQNFIDQCVDIFSHHNHIEFHTID